MRQELGYKEKNGQVTKFGQWYADRVQDTQYRDAPWCDMFLAWAADKADLSDYVGEFAWTPSHAAWFIQQGAWTRKPEPGALVFYDWRGGKSYKGIDHVGVVERVSGKKIHTIEANVDRVWLKRKTRETDKVVGYGIPRLVKENVDRLEEIRSTERPFVGPPRSETGGSALDFLGTPPALLAAMVLMTVLLSLRVTGRRRGHHRRLSWLPWRSIRPHDDREAPARIPSPRNPLAGDGTADDRTRGGGTADDATPGGRTADDATRGGRMAGGARPPHARAQVPAGSGRPAAKRRKPYDPS